MEADKLSNEKNVEYLSAGSQQCPYKLAIVGGGPSGCSIIIRAFRIGFGGELCGFCSRKPAIDSIGNNILADAQFPFQSAGVCLIDEGSIDRFGGGKLQDYVINANTWANKFVTNVMDDKGEVLPKETVAGTPLQKLGNYDTAITLKGVGCKPAPLQMVGAFLRDAGSVVQEIMNVKYPQSSRCMTETSVTLLQQVMLPVPEKLRNLQDNNSDVGSCIGWKLTVTQRGDNFPNRSINKEIFAHKVVLATGGRQDLPRLLNPAHTRKLMSSDFVCTQKGMDEMRSRLLKAGIVQNKALQGRVVIIGGSHSAFSAAWLCLHHLNANVTTDSEAGAAKAGGGNSTETAANKEEMLVFGQNGICLVHKSSIKVFYCTKADADKDGYVIESAGPTSSQSQASTPGGTPGGNAANRSSAAAASQMSKSWIRGQIHPFGGLRGDAKELWRSVKDGRETRVKLLQVRNNVTTLSAGAPNPVAPFQKQQSIVEKLFDEAVVIVWACGYSTNLSMPVLDLQGVPVAMRIKSGQVEVDEHARVVSAHPTIGVLPTTSTTAAPPATITHSTSTPSLAQVSAPVATTLLPDSVIPPSPKLTVEASPVENVFSLSLSGSPSSKASKALSVPTSPTKISTSGAGEVASIVADDCCPGTPKSAIPLPPATLTLSPPFVSRTSSFIVKPAPVAPVPPVVEGLLGSGLGFGLQALLETGLPDGSSGRADGVAVYLKRGATLVLAQVLGNRVFGGPDIKSWEDRLKLIKKIAIVANASAVKVVEGAASTIGPGIASSLDSGTSLFSSPTKRPNTTTSMRNSFSGVGFNSPSSKGATPLQGGVLKRAIASKESAVGVAGIVNAVTVEVQATGSPGKLKSPSGSFAAACDSPSRRGQSSSFDFTFPQVTFPAADQVGTPTAVRPRSGSFGNLLSPSRPATAGPQCGAISPRRCGADPAPITAMELIKHSPEARRCAELVDKVANLSVELEHLKLQSAKEFLSIPKEGSTVLAQTANPAPVTRSQTPAVIPKTAGSTRPESGSKRTVAAAAAPSRTASASRGVLKSGGTAASITENRTARTDRSASNFHSTKNAAAVTASNTRVVLTPLDLEVQKKLSSKTAPTLTPRSVRANTGTAIPAASSASSTPRGKVPTKPVSAVVAATPSSHAVLRSNSLNHNQINTAKSSASTSSPRIGTGVVSRSSSGSSAGSSASSSAGSAATSISAPVAHSSTNAASNIKNSKNSTSLQAKNVKLELPSIPMHKRSQNQREESNRVSATVGKDQGIAMGQLVKALSVGAGGEKVKLLDAKSGQTVKAASPVIIVNK